MLRFVCGLRHWSSRGAVKPTKKWDPRTHREPRGNDDRSAAVTISRLRSKPTRLEEFEISKLESIIRNSELSEKNLSLSVSLLLSPVNYSAALAPTIGLVMDRLSSQLTLQGVNQILGALAKLKTKRPETDITREISEKSEIFLDFFSNKFLTDCPNRELSNISWAMHVLRLPCEAIEDTVATRLSSFDACDLSLVCAGLMDMPDHKLWPSIRQELLCRKRFTPKDIGSIMCSLACAGINDRELILHLASIVDRTEILQIRNLPALVWALATCDSFHAPLLTKAQQLLKDHPEALTDALDVRRVSRGFAVTGQLAMIEAWLMERVLGESKNSQTADSLLIWELTTNGLGDSALKLFRSRPMAYWKGQAEVAEVNASQLYHLYLFSLLEGRSLNPDEERFLKSLESKFSCISEDMSSSVLHRQASQAVRKLKYEHVSEYKDPATGYIVDIYIPEINTAVEVQGPTHFVVDLETGAYTLRPADMFKHRVLSKVSGIRVVQATPWNFGSKLSVKNETLMKALIENKPVPKQKHQGHRRPKTTSNPV